MIKTLKRILLFIEEKIYEVIGNGIAWLVNGPLLDGKERRKHYKLMKKTEKERRKNENP